jgi:hypothetical protein
MWVRLLGTPRSSLPGYSNSPEPIHFQQFSLMKPSPCCLALCLSALPLAAQDGTTAPVTSTTISIPGPVADGTSSDTAPAPEVPDFQVLNSTTLHHEVTEAAPLPGLPPVTGEISLTVKKVVDPQLPETTAANDAATSASPTETPAPVEPARSLFVAASVYDHSRTFLQIRMDGNPGEEIKAWSNLDFNHFSGFAHYRVTKADGSYQERGLMMGLSDIDTQQASASGDYVAPQIPSLPDLAANGPAFVVVEGTNAEALTALGELHELYRREGVRLAEAYQGRVTGEAQRRAELLANPPKPKDVVLHYWRGQAPANAQGGAQ